MSDYFDDEDLYFDESFDEDFVDFTDPFEYTDDEEERYVDDLLDKMLDELTDEELASGIND